MIKTGGIVFHFTSWVKIKNCLLIMSGSGKILSPLSLAFLPSQLRSKLSKTLRILSGRHEILSKP